jgi:hypothetical protein
MSHDIERAAARRAWGRDMQTNIVLLTGLAGSRKATLAKWLVEHLHDQRVRLAEPLEATIAAVALTGREIDGDLKEKSCDRLYRVTPVRAQQAIGVECGRFHSSGFIDSSLAGEGR